MHARNRTWMLGSDPVERCRQRTMNVEGGDGSTLSLDFTTGVLDPRLLFTRSTNATFINSQGYVEYAGANILLQGSNLGSASWTATGLTSRNASTDPNGSNEAVELSEDATTGEHRVLQLTSQNLNGLVYTSSVYMKAGTNRTVGFIRDNSVASDALVFYTLTGSGSATIANGSFGIVASITRVGTTDWYRCVFTIKASSIANVHIGTAIGTANGNWSFAGTVGNSIHVWGAQVNLGSTAQTYYPTTTAAYHAPRFDYDPTTLTPRGLLIEGSASNRVTDSQNITTGTWTVGGNTALTANTIEVTDPAGGNTATKIALAANVYCSRAQGVVLSTNTTYTFSFWVRGTTGSAPRAFESGGSDLTCTPSTFTYTNTGWTRVQTTFTTGPTITFIYVYVCSKSTIVGSSDVLYVWGAQLEAGSGASSYIPTGASQGSRAADTCYLTDFAGWSAGGNFNTAEGTLFVDQAVTFVGTANYPMGGFGTSNTAGSRFGWQYRQGDSPQGYRGSVNAGYVYELPIGAGWSIPSGTTRFRHAMSCGGGTTAFLRQSFKSSASSGSPTQNNYSDTSTLNISGVAAFTLTQSIFASSVRIARVKYYPRAFTLAQLDELTN